MVFKKKVITHYLDGKCVNSNLELSGGSCNDEFYRFELNSAAGVVASAKAAKRTYFCEVENKTKKYTERFSK